MRASHRATLLLLVATSFQASAQDIDAVDVFQDFDFTTLNDANLAANDHGNLGIWTVTDPNTDLSTSTSGEKISTGLIGGNSDSGGTRGMALTTPAATNDATIISLAFTDDEQETCSYGFWYQFPAGFVGSDDEHDLLYVENNFGTQELYVKHTDHTGMGGDLFLYTGEAGYSSAIDISGSPGTWLWITALHQTGGAGSPHRLRVYDEDGAQVGSEVTRTSHATEASHTVQLGSAAGPLQGYTGTHYFDDFVIDCTDATFPLGPAIATGTTEQEGFRWGVDDDTEADHTFEAAQDTSISIADDQSRLLRVLVDGTDDPASIAYTLRAQKNDSGGYVAVAVGSTSKTTPVIEAADSTSTANNTATTSWALSYPNASTGDLLVFCIAWDDSTTTTDVAEPAGPNGETLSEVNATPATDAGATETRAKCWYTVATGTWTASTLTFTPTASEQWSGHTVRVPAGEFDATPIGGSGVNTTAGTGDTAVLNAAFTAGGTDGSGKLVSFSSADVDPQTAASGWAQIATGDPGAITSGFFTRNTAVSDSESISAGTVATIAGDSWASVSFVIRAPSVANEVYVTTSANITAGGEATTARLTAPAGKTSGDFTTGRRWDNENGTDAIDLAVDFYTEVEWLVYVAASANDDDFYDFRVYAGANALDDYAVTPRWTIPSAGGGDGALLLRRRRN